MYLATPKITLENSLLYLGWNVLEPHSYFTGTASKEDN